ncbi:helix-turn-helix domain-containing protein [Aneurinibacillus aneurinilyticus]|uniref:helix-turn-helix domain-containing protein n=1 Tax=Aneurinibacillus aneurinilyticus TaxID=1391 RepID=UPI003523A4D7
MYREYRNAARMTIESASEEIGVAPRTLAKYESGEIIPDAEKVFKMSEAYSDPEITHWYCRNACAIGRAFKYEVLDNVSEDSLHMLEKLEEETEEMLSQIKQARRALINSRKESGWCSETMISVGIWFREMLDVDHVIEKIKMEWGRKLDLRKFVSDHNKKCADKGYFKKKRGA